MAETTTPAKKKRVRRTTEVNLDKPMSQEQFAALIGVSQQEVSRLVRYSVLGPECTAAEWSRQYLRFQMEIGPPRMVGFR